MKRRHHVLNRPRRTLAIFFSAGGGISLIFALLLVAFTWSSVKAYGDAAQLEAEGVTITAIVADKTEVRRRRSNGSGYSTTYFLVLDYEVNARSYELRDAVSRTIYNTTPIGQVASVRYWAGDPNVAEREAGDTKRGAQGNQTSALIVGVIGLVALWWFGRKAVNAVLARRFGLKTTAVVSGLVEYRRKNRKTGRGHMVFHTADGVQGNSFEHSMNRLRGIGVGATLNVYQRKGIVFWEGDVGPRPLPPASVPRVTR